MYDRPTRAACIAGIKWAFMWDLRTYPNAPSAMHAFMNCSSEWIVRNTIVAGNADSRSQWAASIPLKIGIVISVTITSGQRRRASDTKLAPSVAVPTTSNRAFKRAVIASSKAGWSSASNTRGRTKIRLPSEQRDTPDVGVLEPQGCSFSKLEIIFKAVCGVFLLGKSLGCKDPLRFGVDRDQTVL
jgi:hypothetical protein